MKEYEQAIMMALNIKGDRPVTFTYNEDKDIWKTVVFEGGWYTIRLEGKFVRSCFKWLKSGGTMEYYEPEYIRLLDEKKELDEKRLKLSWYLKSEEAPDSLIKQMGIMNAYSEILGVRIEEIKHGSNTYSTSR